MLVLQRLLETLEKLCQDDFETFKFYLSENVLDGCNPILQSHLENASRVQTVRKMIDSYGEDRAVKVTVEILNMMHYEGVVEQLRSGKTSYTCLLLLPCSCYHYAAEDLEIEEDVEDLC